MEIDAKRSEIIEFVEKELELFFHGGFANSVDVTGISDSELNEWACTAVLYIETCQSSFNEEQKKNYFTILTDLYSSAWVEISSGGDVDDVDVDDIFDGYDLDKGEFEKSINKAVDLLRCNGLNLTSMVKNCFESKRKNDL